MGNANSRLHEVRDACVDIRFLILGPIANNVYLIDDGDGLIVVDPSCKAPAIMEAAGERKVDAIFVTHNHTDHVGALADLARQTGAPVIASAIDAPLIERGQRDDFGLEAKGCKVTTKVGDGDIVKVGKTAWKVMATPGHTKGGICFFLDPSAAPKPKGSPVLVSGDTLFCGSIGRTDFAGGSLAEMRKSLRYLAFLPDQTVVLPGHDMLTTIKAERKRVFAYYA